MAVLELDAAIVNGNLDQVQLLIQEQPDLADMRMGEDQTPLARAAEHGRFEIVDFLLQIRSNHLMRPNNNGSLPIHWSAQGGHLPVMERLLAATPLQPNEDRATAIVRHLSIRNNYSRSPLKYALDYNRIESVKFLIRQAPETLFLLNPAGRNVFEDCVSQERDMLGSILNFAIKLFGWENLIPRVMPMFQTLLFWDLLIRTGKISLIQTLLNFPPIQAVFQALNITMFHLAAKSGRVDLISHFISEDHKLAWPFNELVSLETILTPAQNGNLPLHLAAASGHDEMVCLLLDLTPCSLEESKDDAIRRHVGTRNATGYIPFMLAILNNHLAIAEILFRLAPETFFVLTSTGRNIFQLDFQLPPMTPSLLRWSTEEFGSERIRSIIANHSPISSPPTSMVSVFEQAMSESSISIYSPFEMAVRSCDRSLIQAMLAIDPDAINSKEPNGESILSMAEANLNFLLIYGYQHYGKPWVQKQFILNSDWITNLLINCRVLEFYQITDGLRLIYGVTLDPVVQTIIRRNIKQVGLKFLTRMINSPTFQNTEMNHLQRSMDAMFYLVGGKVMWNLITDSTWSLLDTIFARGTPSMIEYVLKLQLSYLPSRKVIYKWLKGTMTEERIQFLRQVGLIPDLSEEFINQHATPANREMLKCPLEDSTELRYRIWFASSLTDLLLRWI